VIVGATFGGFIKAKLVKISRQQSKELSVKKDDITLTHTHTMHQRLLVEHNT